MCVLGIGRPLGIILPAKLETGEQHVHALRAMPFVEPLPEPTSR
jgi:hypothetical protein